MLALTRETLLGHLHKLPKITDQYAKRELFITEVLTWFRDVESSLQRLRSPLASVAATQRGLVLAVPDGYQDPNVNADCSRRKTERATTLLALNRVGEAMNAKVMEIDRQLDEVREKIVSFVAAASVKQPLPPPSEPRDAWLKLVWETLGRETSTATLYAYLNGSLSREDRIYLLNDIMENVLSA